MVSLQFDLLESAFDVTGRVLYATYTEEGRRQIRALNAIEGKLEEDGVRIKPEYQGAILLEDDVALRIEKLTGLGEFTEGERIKGELSAVIEIEDERIPIEIPVVIWRSPTAGLLIESEKGALLPGNSFSLKMKQEFAEHSLKPVLEYYLKLRLEPAS